MKSTPVVPARLERRADGAGMALAQTHRLFVEAIGLPARWCGRARFVALEAGFGGGGNFLAAWDAWRQDAQRCERLHYVAIEAAPLPVEDLAALYRGSPLQALADELVAVWPPATHNLHRVSFDGGRVQLLLAFGDPATWLPQIDATVDAFLLDGVAPARNVALSQPRLFKAMARIAAPQASAAIRSATGSVQQGLLSAGFEIERTATLSAQGDTTMARFAPRWARPSAVRAMPPKSPVLVVGAGLAGCAAAWALAEQGCSVLLLDRHAAPAQEASGNPAGLFHGVVHPNDGAHARFSRAAALEAQRAVQEAIALHGARGSCAGLLRLETSGRTVEALQALIAAQGLPPGYVQALDAAQASALATVPLLHPAWFFPSGGWVDPAALARSFVVRAGSAVQWRGGCAIQRLRWVGARWQACDASGQVLAEADQVVLANAGDALRLLDAPGWPIGAVRGQLDAVDAAGAAAAAMPVAGSGYVLPPLGRTIWFGATSDRDDDDAQVRASDRQRNLQQLAGLSPAYTAVDSTAGASRVAWRSVSDDRLPIIGAVPDAGAAAVSARLDQARFVPRRAGLFVFGALGSRGITACALGAQVLAAWVTGAPMPVEADLRDALDPARFIVRRARRGASAQAG